jgi:hypothetical protein
MESGVSVEEFAKTQHFHISNRVSPDGKSHRICGALSEIKNLGGGYIDALEYIQDGHEAYPLHTLTDYQKRIFAFAVELDEQMIMRMIGCGEERARQIMYKAGEALAKIGADNGESGGLFGGVHYIDDFEAWLRVQFMAKSNCGGRKQTCAPDLKQSRLFEVDGGVK